MYSPTKALAEDVKREVWAELQPEKWRGTQFSRYDRDPYGMRQTNYNYPLSTSDSTYQIIKDDVRNEIMAQIQMEEADRLARMYGFDRALSNQRIQQLVDSRYRTVDELRSDLKRDLLALQKMEAERTPDPHVRQIADTLVQEASRQGVPLQQVTQQLNRRPASTGILGWMSDLLNVGQRKGFLCGVGATLLAYLIWPGAQTNLRSVAVRSIEEGMSMVDKAKTFVSGQMQHCPQPNVTDQNPPAPPPALGTNQPPPPTNPS